MHPACACRNTIICDGVFRNSLCWLLAIIAVSIHVSHRDWIRACFQTSRNKVALELISFHTMQALSTLMHALLGSQHTGPGFLTNSLSDKAQRMRRLLAARSRQQAGYLSPRFAGSLKALNMPVLTLRTFRRVQAIWLSIFALSRWKSWGKLEKYHRHS
ncbi:hypothetical protein BR93DRAFT_669260 [Coniochaeta sp. PMI_546]|nr:hypothetical protein BR93DRAFT_669260 [Coniochaeta sp. PMI_546]